MATTESTPRPSRPLRLGTRKSALALAQSGQVARALESRVPGLEVELVPMVTRGDRWRGDLAAVGGKGLFTEDLEAGLLGGDLDFAVHSLKDLPVTLPAGLAVVAYPPRADPRDVLVSELSSDLDGLAPGSRLLTGSLRRRSQILRRRPDLEVVPVRGNVDTRLRKGREPNVDGVILAAAGLHRLGVSGTHIHAIDPQVLLPAPGQGTLALEAVAGSPAAHWCAHLDDPVTARCSRAERAVVVAFGGDCTLPLAAWATASADGELHLRARLATPDGRHSADGEARGLDPDEVASDCVAAMRRQGADSVLERLERAP